MALATLLGQTSGVNLLADLDFVFLDEATSALDPATEASLYQALLKELPDSAIISVAHRTAVADYHDDIIELVPSAAQAA